MWNGRLEKKKTYTVWNVRLAGVGKKNSRFFGGPTAPGAAPAQQLEPRANSYKEFVFLWPPKPPAARAALCPPPPAVFLKIMGPKLGSVPSPLPCGLCIGQFHAGKWLAHIFNSLYALKAVSGAV